MRPQSPEEREASLATKGREKMQGGGSGAGRATDDRETREQRDRDRERHTTQTEIERVTLTVSAVQSREILPFKNVHVARQNVHSTTRGKMYTRSAVEVPCAVVLALSLRVHAALAFVAWRGGEVQLSPLAAGEDACRAWAQGGCSARPARGEHRLHLVECRLHHALQLCASTPGGEQRGWASVGSGAD